MANYKYQVAYNTMANDNITIEKFTTDEEYEKFFASHFRIIRTAVVSIKRHNRWTPIHKFSGEIIY